MASGPVVSEGRAINQVEMAAVLRKVADAVLTGEIEPCKMQSFAVEGSGETVIMTIDQGEAFGALIVAINSNEKVNDVGINTWRKA